MLASLLGFLMIILFLDFDGVLHVWFPRADRSDAENQYYAYLPRLERVLLEYLSVQIVITSDWRLRLNAEQLREVFSPDIRKRILGTTARTKPSRGTIGQRQNQAEEYLRINALTSFPWVALDDDAENYLPGALLILCDDGFRDEEERALRTLLDSLLGAHIAS
jgi:hypothetical protein